MNAEIAGTVKNILKAKKLTHEQTAKLLGIDRVYVTRMLSGNVGNLPQRWIKLLALVGLEITVRPLNAP